MAVCAFVTAGFNSCLVPGGNIFDNENSGSSWSDDDYYDYGVLYITRLPDKTTYKEGEMFDPAGLEITIVMQKDKKSEIYRYSDPKHRNNFDFYDKSLDVNDHVMSGTYYYRYKNNDYYSSPYNFSIPIKVHP
jgi:hypothetical protein